MVEAFVWTYIHAYRQTGINMCADIQTIMHDWLCMYSLSVNRPVMMMMPYGSTSASMAMTSSMAKRQKRQRRQKRQKK